MEWWHWLVLGIILCVAEVFTPGAVVALLMGMGAILTGVVIGLSGIVPGWPVWPAWCAWMFFAVVSVLLLVFVRGKLLTMIMSSTPPQDPDAIIGNVANAVGELDVNAIGAVELRGSIWKARNIGSTALANGDRCLVESRKGLELQVTKTD